MGQFAATAFIRSYGPWICHVDSVRSKLFAQDHGAETVGIDVRIESEKGTCLAELGDPHNRMNRLLSLAVLDSTFCLRFIDPYGDTVFNRHQIPVLQSECSALVSQLTQPNLSEVKRVYLERAGAWPKRAFEEAQSEMGTLSLADLRNHLERLLDLISNAIEKGVHHYVRFVGD